MNSYNIIPKCYKTFTKWCNSNYEYLEIYNKMGRPLPFDVSLRDGLQSLQPNQLELYTTEKKKEIYNTLCNTYNPSALEIGSVVSNKLFPIFNDSLDLFNYCKNIKSNNYLLIPNLKNLYPVLEAQCNNISLISSVSDTFQIKNTKKTLEDNKKELCDIIYEIENSINISKFTIKLYLSCIDECPFEGKIPINTIIKEIDYYNKTLNPDIICLSDTCGTLSPSVFKRIITDCTTPYEKLGVHLHYDPINKDSTKKILKLAFEHNIKNIDVSLIETGGCSVTIKNPKKNLTYELYFETLAKYIIEQNNFSK